MKKSTLIKLTSGIVIGTAATALVIKFLPTIREKIESLTSEDFDDDFDDEDLEESDEDIEKEFEKEEEFFKDNFVKNNDEDNESNTKNNKVGIEIK